MSTAVPLPLAAAAAIGEAITPPPEDWSDPVSLPGQGDVPTWPTGPLGPFEPFAAAVAAATATPPDLTGLAVLGAVSAVIVGAVVVEADTSWREPVNLYLAGIAAPGEGKTPMLAKVTAPVEAIERDRQTRMGPAITEAAARKRIADRRRDQLETFAAKEGTEDAKADALDAAQKAADIVVPAVPRILTKDCTPEGLVRLMADHDGRIAVLTDEGADFFDLASRYQSTGKGNLGAYLAGHDGTRFVSDRAGRDAQVVERATLTVLLFAQPVVVADLGKDRHARGRGLLARILWSIPPTVVGRRPVERPPIPDTLAAGWHEHIRALADEAQARTEPLVLRLGPDAYRAFTAWRHRHEPRLTPDTGDLAACVDWANKLPGEVLRIAGALHALRTGHLGGTVDAETMAAALTLAEYFTGHAVAIFGRMGADDATDDAAGVLRWLRTRSPEFSTRDICRSRDWPTERVQAALDLLERYGWVRKNPARGGPGRPPERWQTNPAIHPTKPDRTETPGVLSGFVGQSVKTFSDEPEPWEVLG